MEREKTGTSASTRRWWLSVEGKAEGPYTESHIMAGVKSGTIAASAYACPIGGQEWKPLSGWPEFAEVCSVSPPPPPPPLPAPGSPILSTTAPAKSPWNPRTIGLLGLLFSPAWAGIMTAINARRLRVASPLWRPITIGLGATVLDFIVSGAIGDHFFVDLVLYLGALALIWNLDLQPQMASFVSSQSESGHTAGWLIPAMAGSPAALLVLLTFLVVPFVPLGPREVCQEFLATNTSDEARQYVTANMYPLLEQLKRIDKLVAQLPDGLLPETDYDVFELTYEGDAPADVGGYLVGCRTFIRGDGEGGEALLMDGCFHLVNFTGDWKIDGWYVTTVNGEPVDQGTVSMTEFWRRIADEIQKTADAQGGLAGGESPLKYDYSRYNYGSAATRHTRSSSQSGDSSSSSLGDAQARSASNSQSVNNGVKPWRAGV